MPTVTEQIRQKVANGEYQAKPDADFSLDTPTAVLKPSQSSGGGGGARPDQAPQQQIEEYRLIAETDPLVGECVDLMVDYLVGTDFKITPANVPGTDEERTIEDIAELKQLVERSPFSSVINEWVWHAIVDGTAFLEIVVEEDQFKPKVLPTEDMEVERDEFGNVVQYIQSPDGGDEIEFDPYDLAVLKFHDRAGSFFGKSFIEKCQEQADMLRDMEIDLARFIATKAYPPILWKLGDEDRRWSQTEIDDWLAELENIDPETQLAVGHDVEHEVVGTTSTSSSAGMLKLDSTFQHLQSRIATAFGIPSQLVNLETQGAETAQVTSMPKFSRRISRLRQEIKHTVRYEVFASIEIGDGDEYTELPPAFEFEKHSSEEQRLDTDQAIKLLMSGMLTREAFAERTGIDPETELPRDAELDEHIKFLQKVAGIGDQIGNQQGGRPTDTGTGVQSAGREVKSRENPNEDHSDNSDRPQQSATNE